MFDQFVDVLKAIDCIVVLAITYHCFVSCRLYTACEGQLLISFLPLAITRSGKLVLLSCELFIFEHCLPLCLPLCRVLKMSFIFDLAACVGNNVFFSAFI